MLVSLVPSCLSWSSVHQCISRCGCAVGVLQLSRYFPYYLLIDWMGTWRRWARTQARQDGRSPVPHCTGGQPQYIVDGDCGIVTCYIERLWVVCNSLQLQCKLLYAHKSSKTGFDPKRANKKCHGVCANLLPLVAQRVEKSQHDSVFVESVGDGMLGTSPEKKEKKTQVPSELWFHVYLQHGHLSVQADQGWHDPEFQTVAL